MHDSDLAFDPGGRVGDASRLNAIAEAHLHGQLGDMDLDAVVSTLAIAIGVPMAVINVVTPNLQTYVAEVGVDAPFSSVDDRVSFCAQVVETSQSIVIADAASHRTYRNNPLVLAGAIGAYAGEPLIDSGVVIGSVAVFDVQPREFTDDELLVLRYQTRLASVVLALRRSAQADPLTGLPNRALLTDRLNHALARSGRGDGLVGIFFIDVDGFKHVNDRLGHAAGDRILVQMADRIGRSIRPGDTLARFGGDEFVIVCEDLTSADHAKSLAERVLASLQLAPGDIDDLAMQVSLGVALAPVGPISSEVLLAQADAAMYRAKQTPGSSWEMADTQTLAQSVKPAEFNN